MEKHIQDKQTKMVTRSGAINFSVSQCESTIVCVCVLGVEVGQEIYRLRQIPRMVYDFFKKQANKQPKSWWPG